MAEVEARFIKRIEEFVTKLSLLHTHSFDRFAAFTDENRPISDERLTSFKANLRNLTCDLRANHNHWLRDCDVESERHTTSTCWRFASPHEQQNWISIRNRHDALRRYRSLFLEAHAMLDELCEFVTDYHPRRRNLSL